jgi:two-component system, response regulator
MGQLNMTNGTTDILLVEDSVDDAGFVRRALEEVNLGARLHVARDGVEALRFLFGAENTAGAVPLVRPKVILLDLKLPRVDGLELLRRLKGNPHTHTIPVVVLSSSQEKRDLTESYRVNVNSYLVKPMDFDEFGALVQALGHYWLRFNQTPKP